MSPRVAAAASRMEAERLPDWKLAYRVDEAAAATGMGESTMWRKIAEGKIEAKKDGGLTVILRGELQRYLQSLPSARAAMRAANG